MIQTLESKKALLACIKSSPNKHIDYLSKIMGIEKEVLYSYLERHDLLDEVILYNKPEKELSDILIGFKKTRTVIPPYEIDFYSDKYKLGVEFNGCYWHSSELKPMYYHQEKAQMAWSNGIRLYQIFEYEWNKPIIISNIQRLCGCLKKVELNFIKEIKLSDALLFLSKTTLSYNKDFNLAIGLFSDELIGVMTLKNSIINNYSESLNLSIQEGILQGLNYIRQNYPLTEINALVDFSKYLYDYEKCFTIKGLTEPELIWYKNGKLSDEKKKYLLAGNISFSEDEYLRKLGYKKIYNCGKIQMSNILT